MRGVLRITIQTTNITKRYRAWLLGPRTTYIGVMSKHVIHARGPNDVDTVDIILFVVFAFYYFTHFSQPIYGCYRLQPSPCVQSLNSLTSGNQCVQSLCSVMSIWQENVRVCIGQKKFFARTVFTHCVHSLCCLTVFTHCAHSPQFEKEKLNNCIEPWQN